MKSNISYGIVCKTEIRMCAVECFVIGQSPNWKSLDNFGITHSSIVLNRV